MSLEQLVAENLYSSSFSSGIFNEKTKECWVKVSLAWILPPKIHAIQIVYDTCMIFSKDCLPLIRSLSGEIKRTTAMCIISHVGSKQGSQLLLSVCNKWGRCVVHAFHDICRSGAPSYCRMRSIWTHIHARNQWQQRPQDCVSDQVDLLKMGRVRLGSVWPL